MMKSELSVQPGWDVLFNPYQMERTTAPPRPAVLRAGSSGSRVPPARPCAPDRPTAMNAWSWAPVSSG